MISLKSVVPKLWIKAKGIRTNNECYLHLLVIYRLWERYTVPISHIDCYHVLDYEHKIVSVVLSHCCYNLKPGEAHTVQYDHQAIEKHIVHKFIYGKPRILSDIPEVVYKRDIYTTVTFDAVRKKIPQVSIIHEQYQG